MRPRVYKTFFMLNSTQHKISSVILKNIFIALKLADALLINVKMLVF